MYCGDLPMVHFPCNVNVTALSICHTFSPREIDGCLRAIVGFEVLEREAAILNGEPAVLMHCISVPANPMQSPS